MIISHQELDFSGNRNVSLVRIVSVKNFKRNEIESVEFSTMLIVESKKLIVEWKKLIGSEIVMKNTFYKRVSAWIASEDKLSWQTL